MSFLSARAASQSGTVRHVYRELAWTRVCLCLSLAGAALYAGDLWGAVRASPDHRADGALYALVTFFLLYGNFVYQFTRASHLKRLGVTAHLPQEELGIAHDRAAAPLLCLIPSYKEELRTVRQTVLSAALQEYPNRRVVLLIDDPQPRANDWAAGNALRAVRALVVQIDTQFREAAAPFADELAAFERRAAAGLLAPRDEPAHLAGLYSHAAGILAQLEAATPHEDHTDRFFVDEILRKPADAHTARSVEWARRAAADLPGSEDELRREYRRLAALFQVEVSSFERKAFENLSHEPNKAMNLNTYIGLIGGSFFEKKDGGVRRLVPAKRQQTTLHVPAAQYVLTLDADSLITADYAMRLVRVMEEPGNERVAVAQTPYSAVPGCSSTLERIAGGTTDIQYLIHQGFTQHRATFWVGANAVLRYDALRDIAVDTLEHGRPVTRFIQDRTVIEDTESTIDLIEKGWSLYNYPVRLAYSATPPDFGSLAIQRARWANGGLIILPKLLRYMFGGRPSLRKFQECFFRVHYLTSIAGVNVGLLLLLMYSFPASLDSYWLPICAAPYFVLYARDLALCGYRKPADLVRVYALNLLLLPVNMAGVLRSVHQACTGSKIPFMRTPKVNGRTRTPARYLIALLALCVFCLVVALSDILLERWMRAAFSFGNATLLVYGVSELLGWREVLSDLGHGWREFRNRDKPALARVVAPFRKVA